MSEVGQDLLNIPFPQMVESLGLAIASAQHALDLNSIRVAQVMSGSPWLDKDPQGKEVVREGVKVSFGGRQLSLLELGFSPTFYQFIDTVIEVKLSISMQTTNESKASSSTTASGGGAAILPIGIGYGFSVSTVSAAFAARNSYSAEGASLIRTKLVPLPPPAVLQDRIKRLLDEQKERELELSPTLLSIELIMDSTNVNSPANDQTARKATVSVASADLDTVTPSSSAPGVAIVTKNAPQNKLHSFDVTPVGEGIATIAVTATRKDPKDQTRTIVLKGELKVMVTKPKTVP